MHCIAPYDGDHEALKHPVIAPLGPEPKALAPPGRALPPPGRALLRGHPQNGGGRVHTIKCLARPVLRPPEGGRGPRVAGGVGVNPDLPVILAEAGIQGAASELGSRLREDESRCG